MKSVMMVFCLIAIGLAAAAGAAKVEPGRQEAIEKALEAFIGSWEIRAVTPEGAAKNAHRLVFQKDGTYMAQDNQGKELWAGTFEIDPTTDPKRWDHRSHEAKKNGTDVLGIYVLDGDTLKVACVVGQWKEGKWVGKERPQSIDAKEADAAMELARVKAPR